MRSFSLRCLSLFSLFIVYQQFCSAEPADSNIPNQRGEALCDCGEWLPFTVSMGDDSYVNQTCGGAYIVENNMPVTINGLYHCLGDDSCNAGYTWTIERNNVFHQAGAELPLMFTPSEAGVYLVEIDPSCQGHDCAACKFSFEVQGAVQTGVDQTGFETGPLNIEMNVTPNPARDLVTLRLTSKKYEAGVISWYNELGIVVQQIYVEWNGGEKLVEMNSQDLPAGIYFVRFNGENGRPIVKVSVYH